MSFGIMELKVNYYMSALPKSQSGEKRNAKRIS